MWDGSTLNSVASNLPRTGLSLIAARGDLDGGAVAAADIAEQFEADVAVFGAAGQGRRGVGRNQARQKRQERQARAQNRSARHAVTPSIHLPRPLSRTARAGNADAKRGNPPQSRPSTLHPPPVFGYIRATFGSIRRCRIRRSSRRAGALPGTHSSRDFMTALGVIIACGVLAIVYGIWAIWSVMKADAGQRQNAGDRRGRPRGRAGLSQAPIRHHRHRRRRDLRDRRAAARLAGRDRLRDRRDPVRRRRLHRHERLGARQRPHRAGGDQLARRRSGASPSRPAPSPACWSPASRCSASPSITPS